MGNNIGGGGKKAKVMKINGETFKIKIPAAAWEIVKDYPGHVLLDSEAVKQFGLRAKPLEPQQHLKPKKIYFLVELPKLPEEKVRSRRARSDGIHMTAKDRLECLMLSRRSASDLSIARPIGPELGEPGPSSGHVRVKMRLSKSQLAKFVEESRDEAEVAEKIMGLCMNKAGGAEMVSSDEDEGLLLQQHQQGQWKPGLGSIGESFRAREEEASLL